MLTAVFTARLCPAGSAAALGASAARVVRWRSAVQAACQRARAERPSEHLLARRAVAPVVAESAHKATRCRTPSVRRGSAWFQFPLMTELRELLGLLTESKGRRSSMVAPGRAGDRQGHQGPSMALPAPNCAAPRPPFRRAARPRLRRACSESAPNSIRPSQSRLGIASNGTERFETAGGNWRMHAAHPARALHRRLARRRSACGELVRCGADTDRVRGRWR